MNRVVILLEQTWKGITGQPDLMPQRTLCRTDLGKLEVSHKRPYRAHVTPKRAPVALILRSYCAHERERDHIVLIALILRS